MSIRDKLRSVFGWGGGQPPKMPKLGDPSEISNQGSLVDAYNKALMIPETRKDLYDIYDDMDEGEVAAILDSFAEDSTQYDLEHKAKIWVEADDKQVKKVILNLFDRLRIDHECESIVRDMIKYGDDFFELVTKPLPADDTIKGPEDVNQPRRIEYWFPKDPRHVDRIETQDGVLAGFNITPTTPEAQTLRQPRDPNNPQPDKNPWDVIHFRLMRRKFYRWQNQRFRNIYGTSILYSAIRACRQLKIMDDLLMLHRILRSLDRHIYYIDVGHASREDEIRTLKKWKAALKRKQWIDPASQRFAARFDPMTWLEDIFWPTRAGSNSKVETLAGQPNVTEIVDHKRFVNRFYGIMRVPKGYFGHEDDQHALVPKNTLAQQDVQYGRRCNSIQGYFIDGITRLCQIELALRNMDPDPNQFKIRMSRPSSLEEQQRVDVTLNLIESAKAMIEFGTVASLDMEAWTKHVLKSTLGMTSHEIAKFTKGMAERVAAHPEMGLGDYNPTPSQENAPTGYNASRDIGSASNDGDGGPRDVPPDTGEPITYEGYDSIPINEIEARIRKLLSRPRNNGHGDVRLYEHPGDNPPLPGSGLPSEPTE